MCPGLRHNGNTCTTSEGELNGRTYDSSEHGLSREAPNGDFSIRVHQEYIEQFDLLNRSTNTTFRGEEPLSEAWGVYGDHSAFYVVEGAVENPFGGRLLLSYWVIANGSEVSGASNLAYDFSIEILDLSFSRVNGGGYSGPSSFAWRDLPLNSDASFYMPGHGNDNVNADPHPTLGYVDGDLYGRNHEEFAGVFERYGMVGAFGSSMAVPEPAVGGGGGTPSGGSPGGTPGGGAVLPPIVIPPPVPQIPFPVLPTPVVHPVGGAQ